MKLKNHIQNLQEIDIDLAPLLSIMVMLIPVLLISSNFNTLVVVDTSVSDKKAPLQQDMTSSSTSLPILKVHMIKDKGFLIELKNSEQSIIKKIEIPLLSEDFDFKNLNEELVKIKYEWPLLNTAQITNIGSNTYADFIRSIDILRRPLQENVTFVDGQNQESNFMFPYVEIVPQVLSLNK